MGDWPQESEDRLRKLVEAGMSCTQIGAAMGISRSAAIGKVHRMGLTMKRAHGSSQTPRPRGAQSTPQPRLRRMATPPAETCIVERKLSLMELREGVCRFPIGDVGHPDFYFCGADTWDTSSYCPHHSRVAFQPRN